MDFEALGPGQLSLNQEEGWRSMGLMRSWQEGIGQFWWMEVMSVDPTLKKLVLVEESSPLSSSAVKKGVVGSGECPVPGELLFAQQLGYCVVGLLR